MKEKPGRMRILNAALLLLLAVGALALLIPAIDYYWNPEPYTLDLEASCIDSVSVYYTNEAQKKAVTRPEDIQKILVAINAQENYGPVEELPAGGLGFVYVFCLTDGTQRVCTLSDGGEWGLFDDGVQFMETKGMDGLSLWDELDYEIHRAVADQEVYGIPAP